MATRAVWRPQWWAWTLLALASLVFVREATPSRLEGHWLIFTPLVIVAGVLLVRRLWELPPAVTMCAAIALTIFSGAWRQIGLGGLPLDRLLVAIVLLQYLLRSPGAAQSPRLQFRNVHLLMGLAIIYALASADASGTLTTEAGFLSLFDQFGVVPFLVFFMAPAVFAGRRERDWLLATLVGLGAYLGFTAIFEAIGPHSLVFPRYILRIDEALPDERAGGPFQAVIAEGFATFGCAVAAVMAFAQWQGQRKRVLAAIVAIVCIFGCLLTLERGVWIAAVIGSLIAALATRKGRRWLILGALTCVLAVGGALAISPALAERVSTRTGDQATVWDRENEISAGLRMVAAKPLLGFGWDRYSSDSLDYFRQAADYPMEGYALSSYTEIGKLLPLHETYLAYAVELGLVGALLWLASLLWGVGGAIFSRGPSDLRPWKLGLLAVAVCFLIIAAFNPYQAPFPVMLLWVWAGVALGRAPQPARATRFAQGMGGVPCISA
jgi:putative inorganic carbon (hco3(-)) transporter